MLPSPVTFIGATGPATQATAVMAAITGFGWKVSEERSLAPSTRIGKDQLLSTLLTVGHVIVRPHQQGRLCAVNMLDDAAWFAVTYDLKQKNSYACGVVSRQQFRNMWEKARSAGVLTNMDRRFLNPHWSKRSEKYDEHIVVLEEPQAQAWVKLDW